MSAAIDDRELAARARKGDAVAFEELCRRHAPAAWRLAQIVTRRQDALAASAAATALAGTFGPNGPDPEATVPAGELLAAVREAGLAELRDAGDDRAPADAAEPPHVRALLAMPERWRSLLWLLEVEEVPGEVGAAALRLTVPATDRLAAKVRAGFREKALTAAAAGAVAERPGRSGAACQRALTAAAAVDDHRHAPAPTPGHLRRCPSCRAAVATAGAPADDLAPWVAPLPATLAGTAHRRWLAAVGDTAPAAAALPTAPPRRLPGWARRAVSGGCAALLLVGVTSAMSVGGDPLRAPVFGSPAGAAPFAAVPFQEAADGRSSADLPRYELARGVAFQGAPTAAGGSSTRYAGGTSLTGSRTGPDGAPSADRGGPTGGNGGPSTPGPGGSGGDGGPGPGGGTPPPDPGDGGGGPSPTTPPPTSPPPTSPPPTSPPPTSPPPTLPPPTTPPPPGGGGGGDDDDSTTIGNDDAGISVGDCTGAEVGPIEVGCPPGEDDPDVTVPPIGLP